MMSARSDFIAAINREQGAPSKFYACREITEDDVMDSATKDVFSNNRDYHSEIARALTIGNSLIPTEDHATLLQNLRRELADIILPKFYHLSGHYGSWKVYGIAPMASALALAKARDPKVAKAMTREVTRQVRALTWDPLLCMCVSHTNYSVTLRMLAYELLSNERHHELVRWISVSGPQSVGPDAAAEHDKPNVVRDSDCNAAAKYLMESLYPSWRETVFGRMLQGNRFERVSVAFRRYYVHVFNTDPDALSPVMTALMTEMHTAAHEVARQRRFQASCGRFMVGTSLALVLAYITLLGLVLFYSTHPDAGDRIYPMLAVVTHYVLRKDLEFLMYAVKDWIVAKCCFVWSALIVGDSGFAAGTYTIPV